MATTTDIQERKIELIQWLSVIDDISLPDRISDLKVQVEGNWADDLADDEIASIAKGLADAGQGKLQPHSKAFEIYKKWL
ncbi:MAG: hypothetical protein KA746_03970 [Pyrinomonadaceae bacterium]|nr:hypothetical protein [Pyrinomonadaceae bacterium]MBP6211422.1 hypothetical protein [Pyrinomonadaceae bacterium]